MAIGKVVLLLPPMMMWVVDQAWRMNHVEMTMTHLMTIFVQLMMKIVIVLNVLMCVVLVQRKKRSVVPSNSDIGPVLEWLTRQIVGRFGMIPMLG